MNTKIIIASITLLTLTLTAHAQTSDNPQVEQPFRANLINNEYQLFMNINLYDNDIMVPGQEVFGLMAGYLVRTSTTFYWFVTSAVTDSTSRTATLYLTNDYGSEDLTAQLVCENDSTYTLKQLKGSVLKVPKNGKWQKLPKNLTFIRKK